RRRDRPQRTDTPPTRTTPQEDQLSAEREMRCPPTRRLACPLSLVHPDTPEHRVLLAGERYGVALPWPPGVHRASGTLPLPPTKTARGAVTWVHPPEADALRLCREVDVFAALRTALRDPPM
ncbi:MAG: hypothetical protein ACRDRR_19895, partial [Pseudonocardiaceae bacterium]